MNHYVAQLLHNHIRRPDEISGPICSGQKISWIQNVVPQAEQVMRNSSALRILLQGSVVARVNSVYELVNWFRNPCGDQLALGFQFASSIGYLVLLKRWCWHNLNTLRSRHAHVSPEQTRSILCEAILLIIQPSSHFAELVQGGNSGLDQQKSTERNSWELTCFLEQSHSFCITSKTIRIETFIQIDCDSSTRQLERICVHNLKRHEIHTKTRLGDILISWAWITGERIPRLKVWRNISAQGMPPCNCSFSLPTGLLSAHAEVGTLLLLSLQISKPLDSKVLW